VKYLLIIHMNRGAWNALAETEREEMARGHRTFQESVGEAGELISTHSLADPLQSSVVRVREGVVTVTTGPVHDSSPFPAGYYMVDCDSRGRAEELAAEIPDARIDGFGIEVRPVMVSSGEEM